MGTVLTLFDILREHHVVLNKEPVQIPVNSFVYSRAGSKIDMNI